MNNTDLKKNPPFYLGTKFPYIYTEEKKTPPPHGYKPFYIDYLIRNSARHLSSKDKLTFLIDILQKNSVDNNLTEDGVKLFDYLKIVEVTERNRYQELTKSGASTMKSIAKRMLLDYPEVFGRKIYAESTYVQRVIDSMFAFIEELFPYTPEDKFIISSNGVVDPILRFFDLNTSYIEFKNSKWWIPLIESHRIKYNPSIQISMQFFQTTIQTEILQIFAPSLFDVLIEEFDISEPPLTAIEMLHTYFTDESRYYYWNNNNKNTFYEKGPSGIDVNLPTNISFALLRNFIETSDEALRTGEISANLRFAHSSTVIPFSSILMLSCCNVQTDFPPYVSKIWTDYDVSPMAANIAWIFYKHPATNEILVKMTYNEQEICFPFATPYAPYTDWEHLRAFYCSVLNNLSIDCTQTLVEQVKNYPMTSSFSKPLQNNK